jgi:hypothetical protein
MLTLIDMVSKRFTMFGAGTRTEVFRFATKGWEPRLRAAGVSF